MLKLRLPGDTPVARMNVLRDAIREGVTNTLNTVPVSSLSEQNEKALSSVLEALSNVSTATQSPATESSDEVPQE